MTPTGYLRGDDVGETVEVMRSFVFLMVLLAGLSGCGKKTYEKFYELEGRQSVLVADQGDGAYDLPEMDQIISGLDAVPNNAREKDRAIALVTQLKAERARVKAANKPPEVVAVPQNSPTPSFDSPVPAARPSEGQAPSAGPSEPTAGMSVADFRKAFGNCFSSADAVLLPDGAKAEAQELSSDPQCQVRFHANGARLMYLFKDDRLVSMRTVSTFDAGVVQQKAVQVPAPVVDAGSAPPPQLYVPGGPLPGATNPVNPGAPVMDTPQAPTTVTPTGQPTGADAPPPAADLN